MKRENKNIKIVPVKNNKKYHEFIRCLRNHKKVRRGFIHQGYITKRQQAQYMKKHSEDYYVCLINGVPAGYVGVVNSDIRVATDPRFQRQGLGLFMIKKIMRKRKRLKAKIKIDKTASIRLLEKEGFKLKYYIYEP